MKKETLDSWDKFCSMYNGGEDFSQFGFAPDIGHGDIFRFNARFSFFREFQSIKLTNYNDDTSGAYSKMMKLTLMWGAFESLMNVTGKSRSDFDQNYDPVELGHIVAELSDSAVFAIYDFISSSQSTNSTHRRHLSHFKAGSSFGLTYLVTAIRNSFAHGILTPHSGSKNPKSMSHICDELITFFVPIIEHEFTALINCHPNEASY